jgi:hydrogenase maturation protein HypF
VARQATTGAGEGIRVRARVTGTVQGVGFRPYVFRLASALALGGYVLNDDSGVLLEVEGRPELVDEFVERLPLEAPPLSAVEKITSETAPPTGERRFRIAESLRAGDDQAQVSPDVATCRECLGELFDPADRRYRYPYINCTNCGPRLTIVNGVPYDRPLTTMAPFEMCARCRSEYEDPEDRRFHAQPNACPACGPRFRLLDAAGIELGPDSHRDPVAAAARLLRSGHVVAVKGVGGYHLACRADDEAAVASLRSRKHREDRPFALMPPDLDAARALVELTPHAEGLLVGPERPILVARRRRGAGVAAAVAPGSADLGVMLPYSPLHHLLLDDAGVVLVMTSGNISDEPITRLDEDALERLGGIADAFLVGERRIRMRADDSVIRAVAGNGAAPSALALRRSRGYVPRALELEVDAVRPVLGCGAELKSTFCLAKSRRAWVGPHVGDLKNYETLVSFEAGVEHFEQILGVAPEVIAHDLHPDYLSTRYAVARQAGVLVGVQHHHAHLAACLAEWREEGPAIGAIYDGSGYGEDGTAWGGELLAGDLAACRRAGHLLPVSMLGGDAAVREPWRMTSAWLAAAFDTEIPPIPATLAGEVTSGDWEGVSRLGSSAVHAPATTSVGRLFDAVAALCGIRARATYEGQAAAELEWAADVREPGAYPLPLLDAPGGATVLDARATVRAIAADRKRGIPTATISARFHTALAGATATACEREAERLGVSLVALSGGAFQNRLLLERTVALLRASGLRLAVPRLLPPNDGGISFGQVAVACARARAAA